MFPRPSAPLPALAWSAGFTAIELLVALAIAAILAAIAVPSFGGVMERYRVRRASEDMTTAIYLARTEALRRGGNVTLQKASRPDCAASSPSDWRCGWLVFADADNDGVLGPDEQAIQVWTAPERVDVRLRTTRPSPRLQVNRWGRFGNNLGFSVTLRPRGNDETFAATVLCMSAAGRLERFPRSDRCPD